MSPLLLISLPRLMFYRCYFLSSSSSLMVALETNYLRMYWTDRHQIFRTDKHVSGHDQSDLLFAIAQGTLL